MNAQNLTQKSLEAIQTAQSMALENRNNYITPEHLLYALVDQDGGLIPSLLGKMGVDCNAVLAELDTAISALPKVGSTSDAYLSPETNRILTAAEKAAKAMGDSYVSVEHLMIGIFTSPTAVLVDQGIEQVLRGDIVISVFEGHGLSGLDSLKAFLSQILCIHTSNLL